MKDGQKAWTREELLLAINLYCKTQFGRLHKSNPDVIALAKVIRRTPSSVAYKLVNFASLDPSLIARGIKGASNSSKLDRIIWNEFFNNIDDLAWESEKIFAGLKGLSLKKIIDDSENIVLPKGKIRDQIIKARVNQSFFRKLVLASYNNTCCITGLAQPQLLIAGHIKPWSLDEKNRMNPSNGIAINALHDKAFEKGLMTITPDYTIKISSILIRQKGLPEISDYFLKYNGKKVILPSKFLPNREFLEFHNQTCFNP
ncbi:MAG: HNH endonuclease [Bacteroidales bacterium]